MSSFSIDTARRGEQCRLAFSGEMDLSVADGLVEFAIQRLAESDTSSLLIDLDAVSFIDCAGLGALIAIHNVSDERGKRVALRNLPDCVRKLLALTGQAERFAGTTAGSAQRAKI